MEQPDFELFGVTYVTSNCQNVYGQHHGSWEKYSIRAKDMHFDALFVSISNKPIKTSLANLLFTLQRRRKRYLNRDQYYISPCIANSAAHSVTNII